MSHEGHRFTVGHATVRILQDEDASHCCPVFDTGLRGRGWGPIDDNVLFIDLGRRSGMRPEFANGWGPDELRDYAKENKYWEIPLYKYEHSGTWYRTGDIKAPRNPFMGNLPQGHAEFDSGRCGSILLAKKEWRLSKKAQAFADSLCEEVTDWFNGNVWGYVIDLPDDEHVDSCWGFIGDADGKYIVEQATASAQSLSDKYERDLKKAQESADIEAARKLESERVDMYGNKA